MRGRVGEGEDRKRLYASMHLLRLFHTSAPPHSSTLACVGQLPGDALDHIHRGEAGGAPLGDEVVGRGAHLREWEGGEGFECASSLK